MSTPPNSFNGKRAVRQKPVKTTSWLLISCPGIKNITKQVRRAALAGGLEGAFPLDVIDAHMAGCKGVLPIPPTLKSKKRGRSHSVVSSSASGSSTKSKTTLSTKAKGKKPVRKSVDFDSDLESSEDDDGRPLIAASFPRLPPPFSASGQSGSEEYCGKSEGEGDGEGGLDRGRYHLCSQTKDADGTNKPTPTIPLCPYCDFPLPVHPTPALCYLLAEAFKVSTPAPSLDNPDHRQMSIFRAQDVCKHHRMESKLLLEPGAQDWLREIDFSNLKCHLNALPAFIQEPAIFPDFDNLVEQAKDHQLVPRIGGDDDKAVGDSSGCGYYGGEGWDVIGDFLLPPVIPKIDPLVILPLSHLDFRFYALVPYAAYLLIAEDLPLLSSDAVWDVLQQSKDYGLTFFPGTV